MTPSLKYAVVERERRFLVRAVPEGARDVWEISDKYLDGTRLRLREVRKPEGVQRKLAHKVRLVDGDATAVACTSLYLDEDEWAVLSALPGRTLTKRRHHVERDGVHVAVDVLPDGTCLAEIDDGEAEPVPVPAWLDVIREVTHEEAWTGAGLAGPAPRT